LEKDRGTRLGRKGFDEIKKHPFFEWISFEDLKKEKYNISFKPTIDKDEMKNILQWM
jgi:hypothetical protein